MKAQIIEILQRTTPNSRKDINDTISIFDEGDELRKELENALTYDEAAELITKLFDK